MARGTWYRYSKILGLNKKRSQYKKKRKRISIRANIPNKIWHMDVTYYKTIDNIQYYIYTIVDNFSRKIIAYDVSKKLSANFRLESLKRAIENEFNIQIGKQNPTVDLMVDGGSENNNHIIHEFIRNQQVKINKKIT